MARLWLTGVLLLVAALQCQGSLGIRVPKKYVVNLDLPEQQRWSQVILEHKWVILDIHKFLTAFIPEELLPLVDAIASDIETYIDAPYANEMRGISKALNCSVGEVVAANIVYDVSAFCTSIVSQDAQGQIWHSRNLDYLFTNMLENITIHVDFQHGGQTVYSAVTYAGLVGLLTGQRPKAFSITVDERDEGNILENLLMGLLYKNIVPVTFLVRNSLNEDADFATSVTRLSQTHTTAPVYFIVAGIKNGDGAVVSKDRIKAADVWYLNLPERWFVVETNYDHWTTPPPNDNRRTPAIKAMNSMGRSNITVNSLFNVMSKHPVLNENTVYTVVMSPVRPELMQSWIRD